ncbi:MAG: DNA internalization-related competence protein ComEC/Rec2 [Deltaproteobacteria bacterium]
MRRPLLYPVVALITGILIGDHVAVPSSVLLTGALAVLLMLLLCLRKKWNPAAFFFLFVLLLIVGSFNIQRPQYLAQNHHHIVHHADQGLLTLEGVVLANDQISPTNNILVINCRRLIKNNVYLPVTGDIRLVGPADLSFRYGDYIRFHSKIKKLQSFHNPGSFNYERYLNRQGIYVSGFLANSASIVLIRHNSASGIKLKLETFRLFLKKLIYDNAPSPQREIIEAMTIGNQNHIPSGVRDNFAKTGISHILSISGLHIGIVAACGFFVIFFLLKSSEYLMLKYNIVKIATAAAFMPVIIYALVAGMGTPVLRATLMTLAFLTALLIEKQKDLYNILFSAALIILIIAPESLFEISFQLSFGAVFAILYIVPKFSDLNLGLPEFTPHWLQTLIHRIFIFALVSASATVGTLPIIVFYFNRVSAVTLIGNMIAVPLLGILALIPAMAFILTSVFSAWLAGLLISVASFFTGMTVSIINALASLPWSAFTFTRPSMPEIVLFYVFIFLLIEVITPAGKKKKKGFHARHPSLVKAALIISLALIITDSLYLVLKDQFSADLRITAIDVGQGSSTLIQFPHGANMLIDGGGFQNSSFDMGRSVIAPFLYAKRIGKIDTVVLTHPHPDHLQGLIYIINNFDVREIWSTGVKTEDELYQLWSKTIADHKIRIKHVSAQSEPEHIGGVDIHFLWPLQSPVPGVEEISYGEINDTSLVMKISHGANRFLMTGDISSRMEEFLIASGRNLKSDVLIVPHHGSIHSSSMDFIDHVSCRFAIISSGRNNVFRHPHPVILNRYSSAGIDIFRTDQDGAISISSDGITLKIIPWLERPTPGARPE